MSIHAPIRPKSPQAIGLALTKERRHQDRKYGSPARRGLSVAEYLQIARAELDEAQASMTDGDEENALRELLQVIAVGVACLEQHGVVER